jgi:predicted ATPase/transcriptional regulator with XRE-family HTH domain
LRRLRKEARLSQQELADRAGLSLNAVSALERGARKHPYPHTVRSLADALGLSEEERTSLLATVPGRGKTGATVDAPVGVPEAVLPGTPTPLLGRERELGEMGELLLGSGVRLLTLTGIGGVGKTRLAVEAARASLDAGGFPDGVAFVALAPLRDPALVLSTVAGSLGLREGRGEGAAGVLLADLREKRMLLVLDNFEHLLEAAAEVVHLIEACPGLVVLATSRAPLRVRGEQEYPVPPLGLPPSTQSPTGEEVLVTPSGRLFVERAGAASPSFALTPDNAADVAAICWRVAGLPLTIELAAAKARLLEPAALLARLDQALSIAWARDLPQRQRTMRATLDWSYELLSGPGRKLFRRLSVFVGGFTLRAAEAVEAEALGQSEASEGVLGLLGSLVEQSLVVVRPPGEGGGASYGMLEPVRQYALERLERSGEAETVRRLHAAYFLELAERAEPELWGPHESEWLERLEREHDNLRATFSWALGPTGDARAAARLGWAGLCRFSCGCAATTERGAAGWRGHSKARFRPPCGPGHSTLGRPWPTRRATTPPPKGATGKPCASADARGTRLSKATRWPAWGSCRWPARSTTGRSRVWRRPSRSSSVAARTTGRRSHACGSDRCCSLGGMASGRRVVSRRRSRGCAPRRTPRSL